MKYRFKHIAEYALLRCVVGIIRALPYRVALSIGWAIAWLGFHVFRFRRADAERRILSVFGDRFSRREARRIAWLSWRNFLFCAVDMMRIPGTTIGWIRSHIVDHEDARRVVRDECEGGKGAVLVCPHTGSWEMAAVIAQFLEIPIFLITGRQKNPLVDQYLNRLRGSTGIETVQRGSSLLKSVMRRLRDGKVLAFLPDVRAPSAEVKVDFLGAEANVPAGMALFARQTKVAILPVIALRIGWTKHSFRAAQPIRPDTDVPKTEDWQRMTQEVFKVIEAVIVEQPEQWFWFNKRWILDPIE